MGCGRPMLAWAAALLSLFAFVPARAAAPAPAAPLSGWAAVFVAGDFHAHSGKPTEAFDNARVDVAKAFVSAGLTPHNLREFSVRPDRYGDHPQASRPALVGDALARLAASAKEGCLFYLTSHGGPGELVFGSKLLAPAGLAKLVDDACGTRPTVIVLSACYSGSFVPALAGPDRMVLTAARRDRSSFGCGESDRYPYFDACMVQSLPQARDFLDLAARARACVAAKEKLTGMEPASEPQLSVGATLRPKLAQIAFTQR